MRLDLDGIKYRVDLDKDSSGFSASWSCPLCYVSEWLGVADGTEMGAKQMASDRVRKHHA